MWAGIVHTNLVNGVTAWHYFWYVDPTGTNENSELINPAMSTPISIRTYAIAQGAKFVRPGWVRIDATANPVSGVDVTDFKNPSTGAFAIVAVNQNASSSAINFPLTGFTPASVTP
jgi:glucuronoarabinoxylan endo-1,4-beta-xylanase